MVVCLLRICSSASSSPFRKKKRREIKILASTPSCSLVRLREKDVRAEHLDFFSISELETKECKLEYDRWDMGGRKKKKKNEEALKIFILGAKLFRFGYWALGSAEPHVRLTCVCAWRKHIRKQGKTEKEGVGKKKKKT